MALSFSQTSVASLSVGCPTYGARQKVLFDPIHRYIELDDMTLHVMDTPEFQRLRDLKQLGTSYFVFPGASHARFEHSVGVHFLAGQMIDLIAMKQPELEITAQETQAVVRELLGHGPFSHVFDAHFIPLRRPGVRWSHEDMSMRMIDTLIEDNDLEIDPETVEMAKYMIGAGKGYEGREFDPSRGFLFEIVANARNGIDVDKFDYLQRDAAQVGLRSSFDHSRLTGTARVINGEICFAAKEVSQVFELFHTRYSLFRGIYTHRATKALELMVTDIMAEADAAWHGRISSAIDDPRAYRNLTDCILKEIETSNDGALHHAQDLVLALRRRKLYRFVDEFVVPEELAARLPAVRSEDITTCNRTPSVRLTPDDVVVHELKLNYGNKHKSPLDCTHFYRDATSTTSFLIRPDKFSYILPRQYSERIIRVYSRSSEPTVIAAIQRAFRAFLRRHKRDVSLSPHEASRVHQSQSEPSAIHGGLGRRFDLDDVEEVDDGDGGTAGDADDPLESGGHVPASERTAATLSLTGSAREAAEAARTRQTRARVEDGAIAAAADGSTQHPLGNHAAAADDDDDDDDGGGPPALLKPPSVPSESRKRSRGDPAASTDAAQGGASAPDAKMNPFSIAAMRKSRKG